MFTVMPRSSSWGCSGVAHGDRTNPTISAAQGNRRKFLFSSISTTAMWHKSISFLYCAETVNSANGLIRAKVRHSEDALLAQSCVEIAFPTIPDRVETPILSIITRRKAFTVFGLI